MANFKTHFLTAAGLSGVTAIACLKAGLAPAGETPLLWGLGTLGGLLPDIDSDNSVPVRISFTLLAFLLAFVAMFAFVGRYTVLELAAIWLAVFLGVRYLILEVFIAFTTHRGAFHSWLAAAFFGLATASLALNLFGQAYRSAWLCGSFVVLGYFIHLTLDELFSVDLLGRRIKRSFGSALKPVSLKHWRGSLLLALACAALWPTLPPPGRFGAEAWRKLETRFEAPRAWLLPARGAWFTDLWGCARESWCRNRRPEGPAEPKSLASARGKSRAGG